MQDGNQRAISFNSLRPRMSAPQPRSIAPHWPLCAKNVPGDSRFNTDSKCADEVEIATLHKVLTTLRAAHPLGYGTDATAAPVFIARAVSIGRAAASPRLARRACRDWSRSLVRKKFAYIGNRTKSTT
jgi:hypothetical protein